MWVNIFEQYHKIEKKTLNTLFSYMFFNDSIAQKGAEKKLRKEM
jgi:hypothetical protein